MTNELNAPVTRISGPPGTGKTTRLISLVESLLKEGTPPDRIIYTTFSRAGAHEAQRRALKSLGFGREQFKWFRTIHSLCYSQIEKRPVMGFTDYNTIGAKVGLRFRGKSVSTLNGTFTMGKNKADTILGLIHLSRVTCLSIADTIKRAGPASVNYVSRHEVERIDTMIQDYKKEFGRMDYTDMLENFVDLQPTIKADYLIVDEAQDLSPLQWEVVKLLSSGVKRVYVAGDDDQCIHEWNGASSAHLIHLLAKDEEVLNQSYRVPRKAYDMACGIAKKIRSRIPKVYKPREREGGIHRISSPSRLNLRGNETWLLLARHTWNTEAYVHEAMRQGVLFHSDMEIPQVRKEAITAVNAWVRLLSGGTISKEEAVTTYSFLPSGTHVKHGYKKLLEEAQIEEGIDLDDLEQSYGLINKDHWEKAFPKLTAQEREWLLFVQDHDGLSHEPRIRITTIHGSKGLEADNVVINQDLSTQTFKGWMEGSDEEKRVLYVGVTRTRENLYILPAMQAMSYGI